MKEIFFIVFLLIILFSCQENAPQVEVIPKYDIENEKTYLPIDNKDKKESFIIFIDKTHEQLDSLTRRLTRAFKYKIKNGEYNYRLFIDEKGKLDKIKILTSHDESFDKFLIEDISTWDFGQYSVNSDYHKYYFDMKINLIGYDNGSLSSFNMRLVPYYPEDEFLVKPEIKPKIIGGLNSIQNNLKYPEAARKDSIEGKVFVRVFIDTNGNVTDTDVLYGIGGGCMEAAEEAVRKVKFIPGYQKGKPVNTQITIPILFKLGSNKEYANYIIYITSVESRSEILFRISDLTTVSNLNYRELNTPFEIHYDSLDIGTWLIEQISKEGILKLKTKTSGGHVEGKGRKMILTKEYDKESISCWNN
ncbi:MAG: energy transducer TonB [Chlorobi bacterium]|nr:energy transducer TonB [Chlorobiota bacterium]